MSIVTAADDISHLGTILVVGAHPDDETFIAGGLLAAAAANGQRVVCITATRGELGVQDEARWPAAKLAEIRTAELKVAFRELGLREHIWLDYADGSLDHVPVQDGAQHVKEALDTIQADTILTFGPDGLTGHPDHMSVSHWVAEATKGNDKVAVYHPVYDPEHYERALKAHDAKFNMFFNTPQPPLKSRGECDIALDVPDEYLFKKFLALKAMPSQYEAILKDVNLEMFKDLFGQEYFVQA